MIGNVSSNGSLETFFGIPFAKPPVGDLRFAKPVPLEQGDDKATIMAQTKAPSCPQMTFSPEMQVNEDCLYVDVYRPRGIKKGSKVPVLHWTYGGAFRGGSTAGVSPTEIVERSAKLGQPIIVTAANYRVGPFGFIGGSKVSRDKTATSNAGLYDQRLALHWLQDNIAAFGGDPSRVTIGGQSAGSISVALQTTANGGHQGRLFRAAIQQSGTVPFGPVLQVDSPLNAANFDALATGVGCKDATLSCLRKANVSDVIRVGAEISDLYNTPEPPAGYLAWAPFIDDFFVIESGAKLIRRGKFADVPLLIGNAYDEGTLFVNYGGKVLNTTKDFETFVSKGSVVRNTTNSGQVIQKLFEMYPDVPSLGSPYQNPSTKGSLASPDADDRLYSPLESNQAKRICSWQGDFLFIAARRHQVAAAVSPSRKNAHKVWVYDFRQIDPSPQGNLLGATHGADLSYILDQKQGYESDPELKRLMQTAWISFVTHLDPNTLDTGVNWPAYHQKLELLQLKADNVTTIPDDFRKKNTDFIFSKDAVKVFSL